MTRLGGRRWRWAGLTDERPYSPAGRPGLSAVSDGSRLGRAASHSVCRSSQGCGGDDDDDVAATSRWDPTARCDERTPLYATVARSSRLALIKRLLIVNINRRNGSTLTTSLMHTRYAIMMTARQKIRVVPGSWFMWYYLNRFHVNNIFLTTDVVLSRQ